LLAIGIEESRMVADGAEHRSSVRDAFADDAMLEPFTRRFEPLVSASSDVGDGLEQLASHVGAARLTGVMQLTIIDGKEGRQHCLIMSPSGCEVLHDRADHSDLEIILPTDAWQQIASGVVSPLEVFGSGRMRVRGDLRLARSIVAALASPDASE
jgi:putative sterol carrier protein